MIHADYCFEDNCKQQQQQQAATAKVDQSQDMEVNYYDATG